MKNTMGEKINKRVLLNRLLASILAVAIAFSGIGYGGLKSVDAADLLTIKFINGKIYELEEVEDENGEVTVIVTEATSTYSGNTISSMTLGNATGATKDLYMDGDTMVTFDIVDDDNSSGFRAYISNANGAPLENPYMTVDSTVGGSAQTSDEQFSFTIDQGKLSICPANPMSTSIKDYYIYFSEKNGGYSYILNIHVMTKSLPGYFVIDGSRPSIISGKNVDLKVISNPLAMGAYIGTDGYKWSIQNIGDSVGNPLLGSVSPNGSGSTLFEQESRAIFSSDAAQGSGSVRITATTDSGIISENDGNMKCIALLSRGAATSFDIIITPRYPAESVSFTADNYDMQVGSRIPLRSLILPTQHTYMNAQGEYFDPTDDFAFTIPYSQQGYANVIESNGVQYISINSSGSVKLTCTAENPDVTAECTINTYNPTQSIEVSSNDEILANTEGISRNATVRSGNTLTFNVRESSGANEDLIWNSAANTYFNIETISDTGNEKTYVFTADPNRVITSPQAVNVVISTDRQSFNGETIGNISASYRITIYPAYSDDVNLKTTAIIIDNSSSTSDDEVIFDSLDLYQNEKAVVKATPETAVPGEPDDQIEWTIKSNSRLINLEKYKTLDSTTAYTAATITKNNNVDEVGSAEVNATSTSNEHVYKDFSINTKKRIETVRLSIGDITNPTLSKGGEADIDAVVSPADTEEYLKFESEYPAVVEVNGDTGHVKALQKTDSDGVNINVYACHNHSGISVATGNEVTTVHRVKKATINIRVNEIGNVEIDPPSFVLPYNGNERTVTAEAYDTSSGISTPIEDAIFNWSSGNEKVATLNQTQGKSVRATSVKVGSTTITAEVDGSEGVGESFLQVTAPLTDSNILYEDINISDQQSDESYIYLPNGKSQNIKPRLVADGIDSREDNNNKYTLVEGEDYIATDSFEEGNGVGQYSITFEPGSNGLYTESNIKNYSIFPKSLGDGVNTDADISVEQIGDLIYNGNAQYPELRIVYTKKGETETLTFGEDYTVSAAPGDFITNVGTHKVIVTGMNNFNSNYDFPSAFEYEYEIKPYDIEATFGQGTKLLDSKNRILVDDDAIEDQIYTAKEIKPSVTDFVYAYIQGLALNPVALVYDPDENLTDFVYEYSNNINAYSDNNSEYGTATLTIEGKNNYTGTISTTFKIVRKDMSTEIMVDPIDNRVYTGFRIEPAVSVAYGNYYNVNEELVLGKDYTVSYSDNIDSRVVSGKDATITITGKGNYKGSTTQTFVIDQADLSDPSIVTIEDIPDQYDCGTFLKPAVKAQYGAYKLIEGKDYYPFYGRDNGTDLSYNFSVGTNKGVVAILPVEGGNFRASAPTTVSGRLGQEVFFNIVTKTVLHPAENITIKRIVTDPNESTDLLKPNTIFVNAVGGVSVNTEVKFDIEAVCSDGECDDPIYVTVPDSDISKFTCNVETLDYAQGNKAILTVTGGPGAATGQILLMTKCGKNVPIAVVVRDPATNVQIAYDTSKTNMRDHVIADISNSSTVVRERHDFYLIANLSRGNQDEVTWSSSNESVATVDEAGRVTALKQGNTIIKATTKASELYPGGEEGSITMNVAENIMADTITIEPQVNRIRTGRTMQLNGSAVGENGSIVTEKLVWKSDNENVVSIIDGRETSAATIEAKSSGTTTIHYGSEFDDGKEATLQITVYDPHISVSIKEVMSLDAPGVTMINGLVDVPTTVCGVVIDEDLQEIKNDAKVEWHSGNEDIVTVESLNENNTTVNLKFHKVGITTMTVESGDESAVYNVTVKAPLNGRNSSNEPYVTVSGVNDRTYLPNGLVPVFEETAISSVDSRGSQYELEPGKDYVTSNNYTKGSVVGDYIYTLSKISNGLYTESLDVPYSILRKSLGDGNDIDAEIAAEMKKSLVYNGSAQKPDLKVSYTVGDETEVLKEDEDYRIEPYFAEGITDNLTSAGQHKVVVTGLGNYTDSFIYEYTIAPYNIQDIGVNSILRKESSFVTKDAIPDQVYTAAEITPSVNDLLYAYILGKNREPVVLSFNENSSITDFEYSYSDNINAYSDDNPRYGTATLTFEGKNNYTGTVSTTFKIVKKNISTEMYITPIANQTYTGFKVEPEVSVYYGFSDSTYNEKLELDKDFVVAYSNNFDSQVVSGDRAVATITGKGNYTGSTTTDFIIDQANLSDSNMVTIDTIPEQFDCGTLLTPPVTVRMGSYTLIKGVDYLVDYGTGVDQTYNVSPKDGDHDGVVTITPVINSNFTAYDITSVRRVPGQEAFFNIVSNPSAKKADAINITKENGEGLTNGKIYVNKVESGNNTTLKFKIKSVMNDGTESNDAVFASYISGTSDQYFSFSVENLNSSSSGNEAMLTITGLNAGTSQIKLRTKKGTSKIVDVIVLEPATNINIVMDNRVISDGGQYELYENHDYYLSALFNSGSVTDTVSWSVDDESVAVINNEGKLTTLDTGSVTVYVETNPSILSPGGKKAFATFNIGENNLAENVVIKDGYEVISTYDILLNNTATLYGDATRTAGNVTEQLEWISSDENVIRITSGKTTGTVTIEAVGPGKATLSYGSKLDENEGGVRAECEVNVIVPVTQVSLSSNALTVEQGGSIDLTATLNEYASDEFVWTSSNMEAVTISGTNNEKSNSQKVTLTGVKAGEESTITVAAKSNGAAVATCKVQVIDRNAQSVSIEAVGATIVNNEITVHTGDYLNLKGISSNANGAISEILKWKTSNNGKLRIIGSDSSPEVKLNAQASGDVIVTYGSTKEGGVTASITVHIIDTVIYIDVDKTNISLAEGEKTTITAKFNDNATGQFVWKVDDTSAIRLEGAAGNETNSETVTITGLASGKQTKITVSSKDDENVSETIVVTVADIMAETVTLDKTTAEVVKGKTIKLKGTATSSKGTVTEPLEWKSSNSDIIKIASGQGTDTAVFTAVAAGTATITYGSKKSGGVVAQCVVTVKNEESSTESGGDKDNPSDGGKDNPSDGGKDNPSTEPGKVGSTQTIGDNTFVVLSDTALAYSGVSETATKVVIPATVSFNGKTYKVTEIASNAFAGNTKIKSVTIGSNVVKIGDNAFKNCKSLTKITIPKNVKTIGKNAFAGCSKLKTVTFKTKKLTKIGKKAFKTIKKGATFKCPKAKKSKYKKLLKKSGLPKKAKVK